MKGHNGDDGVGTDELQGQTEKVKCDLLAAREGHGKRGKQTGVSSFILWTPRPGHLGWRCVEQMNY